MTQTVNLAAHRGHVDPPWYAIRDIRGKCVVLKDIGDRAYEIAEVSAWGENTALNAALIAQAPRMYEALAHLVNNRRLSKRDRAMIRDILFAARWHFPPVR